LKKWCTIKPGDTVDLIAPAARCADALLTDVIKLLTSWGLHCNVPPDIFGDDLLCANNDARRFEQLNAALTNTTSKAVICVRGGYGSARLIPMLEKIAAPNHNKLFVGMSDITALHIFLQQQWQWPVLHGAVALDKFSPESIQQLKEVMFGEIATLKFADLIPLNAIAAKETIIASTITGGNLTLVQACLGTSWQLKPNNKIIFLEEVNERGFRVDRMLEHLKQAAIFTGIKALLLGDFTKGEEPDGTSKVPAVIERFAKEADFPVLQISGIGHGFINKPLPLGTKVNISLGRKPMLECFFVPPFEKGGLGGI